MKKLVLMLAVLCGSLLAISVYAGSDKLSSESSASTYLKAEKYSTGDGVEKNRQQAFQLFYKAACEGYAKAQNRLGECYQYGLGTVKNPEQAAIWYRKAAEQNVPEAMFNYGQFCIFSNPAHPDYSTGIAWIKNAAIQGHSGAQLFLGTCYLSGRGVVQDAKTAFDWFRKAAEQGNAKAQLYFGSCYYLGYGTPTDYVTAVRWFRKAADLGIPEAYHALGECYEKGNGVQKNVETALFWYRKGAQSGLEASVKSVAILENERSWRKTQPTVDKGRRILNGIFQANQDREAASLKPIWPKKGQWKTSTDYLRWLVQNGYLHDVTEQDIEGWYCLVGAEKESQTMPFLWSSNLRLSENELNAPADYSHPRSWKNLCADENPVIVVRRHGVVESINPNRLSDATFFLGNKPRFPQGLEILKP